MEKQKTKQRILDAALELFSTQGFEATSIAQIADAVGVRKASLYSHFDSKQDILDRLIESIMEDYAKHSVRSPANRIGDELDSDGVVRLVTEQIRYIVHDEHVSRARKMLTIEQYRNPQLAELKTKQSYTDVLAFAEALMDRLVSEGRQMMAAQFAFPISVWMSLCDREPEREDEAFGLIDRHIRQFFEAFKADE